MADLFLKQAENYAEGRPSYPPELFEFIASKTPSQDLAWDVGTGSGQAARSVSFFFPFLFLEVAAFCCIWDIQFRQNSVLGTSIIIEATALVQFWSQSRAAQIHLINF